MSPGFYKLYCIVVIIIATLLNLAGSNQGSYRGFGSGHGSGWSSGGHK